MKTKENFSGKIHQYLLLTVTSSFSAFMIADILARSIGLGYNARTLHGCHHRAESWVAYQMLS
ncbi:MAG: hypothetical protein CM15mP45_07270 [Deltaproteobacteria bacterium]|nr:MAG: hypothetical protein CM15mP45_07270 [Deltaproteobacteria bacterium]